MSDDFGRRLEAALRERFADYNRKCTEPPTWDDVVQSVRAANAQVSAPAPCGVPLKPDQGQAGAGVDLADAMRSLQFCIQTPGLNISAMLKAAQCRALLSHIEALERDAARYRWLRDQAEDYDGHACFPDVMYVCPLPPAGHPVDDAIDVLIDAARKEGKP